MNKRKWIWLSVVLVVIVLIGSIAIRHWNSIEALIDSFRYSQEEVAEKLDENKKQLQEYIDENEDITVRDLTEEEAKLLKEGKLTEEEVVKILTSQEQKEASPEEKPPEDAPTKPTESKPIQTETNEPKQDEKPGTEQSEEKTTSTIVSEAIAKLYIQKNIYLGKLDSIEAKVYNEFYDLVMAQQLDEAEMKALKQQFLKTNLSTVAAWEIECDNVVYGILDEIKTALKENNEDLDIVEKLEEAYLNEKRLKKSYYINRYMD